MANGIAQVTLTNLKDRSTPIFALYAIQKDVIIELIKFDTPLVLKSFESVRIDIPRVSQYFVNGKPYDFSAVKDDQYFTTKICYSTLETIKTCKPISPPGLHTLLRRRRRPLQVAFVSTMTFNGKVYSPEAIYIVEYQIQDKWHDAFINDAGYIDWGVIPNLLPTSILMDSQKTANHLLSSMPQVQQLSVTKTYGWYQSFQPGAARNASLQERPVWGTRTDQSRERTQESHQTK
ncbi:hypothetical protein [Achromobacter sp. DH1f]|uniref:hypothetical protein n=1 Tax=Achromobacter sp. DH1f TaxID=1397275 RepID=UPI0012FE821E|nr:hypothetical protein [Achromobacter sp. DH1f]